VLRPGVVRVARVRVLREEPAVFGIVVPRAHVLQARGFVRHAARVRRFIQKALRRVRFEVPVLDGAPQYL